MWHGISCSRVGWQRVAPRSGRVTSYSSVTSWESGKVRQSAWPRTGVCRSVCRCVGPADYIISLLWSLLGVSYCDVTTLSYLQYLAPAFCWSHSIVQKVTFWILYVYIYISNRHLEICLSSLLVGCAIWWNIRNEITLVTGRIWKVGLNTETSLLQPWLTVWVIAELLVL